MLRERARAAAREYGYDPGSVQVLAHPWNIERAYRVRGRNRHDAALKVWQGHAARQRARSEVGFTLHLEGHGFAQHAALLRTRAGALVLEEPDGLAWTGYEYIDGMAVARKQPAGPDLLGRLLADLHGLPGPGGRARSRLESFPDLAAEARALVPSTAVRRATAIVLEALEELAELPRRCVHGDFNPQNVLVRADEPVLIDLEFARWDVRLLDFASLAAPWRSSSGPFEVEPSFAAAVARAYERRAGPGGGLDERERQLFPAAALAHTLFMVRDLTLAGNGHAMHAHDLLQRQLDDGPWL